MVLMLPHRAAQDKAPCGSLVHAIAEKVSSIRWST